MNKSVRGYVFCMEDIDDIIGKSALVEQWGYEFIVIKHFEDVIDAQSEAIAKGQLDKPVLFFIDDKVFLKAWDNDQVRIRHLKRKYIGVVVVYQGELDLSERMLDILIDELEIPTKPARLKRLLRNAEKRMQLEIEKVTLRREIGHRTQQMRELNKIGVALSAERNLKNLLELILTKAREFTGADAGSIYLVDREDKNALRFVWAQNDSIEVPFNEFTMPLDNRSIAGTCVFNSESINIPDAYEIPEDKTYSHNRDWDLSVGYRTKSILCVPMKNHENETIGCIQLINRKKDFRRKLVDPIADAETEVINFDLENQALLSSFASQAAVAIDNNLLLESIERLFEGLVKASVVAIESRDPTTSGHSERVALLCEALAKEISESQTDKYADVRFDKAQLRELRFAALLHDFGKVGVREKVLVKANKLYPQEQEILHWRIELYKRIIEIENLKQMIEKLLDGELPLSEETIYEYEERIEELQQEYENVKQKFDEATLPKPVDKDLLAEIEKFKKVYIQKTDGSLYPLLREQEFENFQIPAGSLNAEERREIESHVVHSFKFLSAIPWTKDLANIPAIAAAHHEKLNGKGYPQGLTEKEIPLQSKIMAVADIFDALTASDRPYKKAMPVERALNILREEASLNHLDETLVDIFIDKRVYRVLFPAADTPEKKAETRRLSRKMAAPASSKKAKKEQETLFDVSALSEQVAQNEQHEQNEQNEQNVLNKYNEQIEQNEIDEDEIDEDEELVIDDEE